MKMTREEIRKHAELQKLKLAQKVQQKKIEKQKIEKELKQKELEEKLKKQQQEEMEAKIREEAELKAKQEAELKAQNFVQDNNQNVFENDSRNINQDQQEEVKYFTSKNMYESTFGNADTFNDRADTYFEPNKETNSNYSDDEDFDDYFEREEPDNESDETMK